MPWWRAFSRFIHERGRKLLRRQSRQGILIVPGADTPANPNGDSTMTDLLANLDGLPALTETPTAEQIAESIRHDRIEYRTTYARAVALWKSSHKGPDMAVPQFRRALKLARSKTERARVEWYLNEWQRREDAFEASWQALLDGSN